MNKQEIDEAVLNRPAPSHNETWLELLLEAVKDETAMGVIKVLTRFRYACVFGLPLIVSGRSAYVFG